MLSPRSFTQTVNARADHEHGTLYQQGLRRSPVQQIAALQDNLARLREDMEEAAKAGNAVKVHRLANLIIRSEDALIGLMQKVQRKLVGSHDTLKREDKARKQQLRNEADVQRRKAIAPGFEPVITKDA